MLQVQSCDRLYLKPNRTKYIVPAGDAIEIRCLCNKESSEHTVWYYADGTKVPVVKRATRDQPYHKRHKNGGVLVVPRVSEHTGVGVYRCKGGSLVTNISIQLLEPGIVDAVLQRT